MRYGQIRATKTWVQYLHELKAELERWGKKDYILPTYEVSKNQGSVKVLFSASGQWITVECAKWSGEPRKQLLALIEAIHGVRLADQRGIGSLLVEAAKALSLPSGNNYHQVLGIPPGSNKETMVNAWRKRVNETHPDHGGTEKEFNKVMEAGKALGLTG